MRVLHIIPTLDAGGAEKQLCLLAGGLPKDAFETHVCTLTRGGPRESELRAAQIPIWPIGKRWKIDPLAYWKLLRLIRKLRPHVVQTWLFAANSYGRQAAFQAGVPVVIGGERCVDPWKTWKELAIDRYLARRSSRIAVNSSGVAEFYVGRGLERAKFEVIANAIVPSEASPVDSQQWRAELGLPDSARVIGAVGRLWPQKRYRDLMWASDLLATARDDTYLVIAGEGPERDDLLRFRRKLGHPSRIHFLGHRGDVSRWLACLDVFWLGSGYEGQSNALMEAMLAGVPVVVSDIAGNRDLVRPNRDGLFFPTGDRGELARQTTRILDDPDLASKLGRSARARMLDEFSVSRMVEAYGALYRRLG